MAASVPNSAQKYLVLELSEAAAEGALAHQSVILHEATRRLDAVSLIAAALYQKEATGR